jgi:hypothetical protein
VLERKQNFSFSFGPKSMKYINCLDRGEHDVGGGSEEVRMTYILSDQNFPVQMGNV